MIGGTWMDSPNVLNDVRTSHTNGPTMMTATRLKTICGTMFRCLSVLAIVDPPLLELELDGREHEHHEHQDEGNGRAVPTIVVDEGPLEEQVDDRLRLRQRRIGHRDHQVDEVERLQ